MSRHHNHHQHHEVHNHENFNIFDKLKSKNSNLLSLFDMKNTELLNIGEQAPAPSKDYCQLVLNHKHVIFRRWKVTLRSDSETRYPSEIKDTYHDFEHDENLQYNIGLVFGKNMLDYISNIVVKGKLDYFDRMPNKILIKIISKLGLEDIARMAQVNNHFRQICKSDRLWIKLYKQYYTHEITPELRKLAESNENGWRKLFFTNKIRLQLELRRQAKNSVYDDHVDVIYQPRRINREDSRSKLRSAKSVTRYTDDDDSSNNQKFTTFLTEDY